MHMHWFLRWSGEKAIEECAWYFLKKIFIAISAWFWETTSGQVLIVCKLGLIQISQWSKFPFDQLYRALRIIGVVLAMGGIVGTVFLVYRRNSRLPIPEAC
jgi:hypothetical protein